MTAGKTKMNPEQVGKWLDIAKRVGLGVWWVIKHVVPFLSAFGPRKNSEK